MLTLQTSFLIFSFTFFAPLGSSNVSPTAPATELLNRKMDEIEVENCFHELQQEYVNSAIVYSDYHAYADLDLLTQVSDGYESEALGVSLGHLFYEDTIDFLDYYLNLSSTDFKFLFLSELELNCEMQSETEVRILKEGWLTMIRLTDSSPAESETFAELIYQIENL